MTKEEFVAKMNADSEWAPGWDAIENEFARLYPLQEPKHYGTNMAARAIFGGNQYLDGYSIYTSGKDYKHIVTFGMSELYADEEAFGGEWSRWGYEMTFKLKEADADACMWVLDMLSNLAYYTYTQERFFEPHQYIGGGGTSLHKGIESAITALITVRDTEAQSQDTLYGQLDFIQLVGITQRELEVIQDDPDKIAVLVERMKEDNPDLVTDMNRTKSYL